MILTFQCTKRVETPEKYEVTLTRTLWSVPSGEDDEDGDEKFELCHWTTPGATPFCVEGSLTFDELDDDDYEVGRHYGFTGELLALPEDDDNYDG